MTGVLQQDTKNKRIIIKWNSTWKIESLRNKMPFKNRRILQN